MAPAIQIVQRPEAAEMLFKPERVKMLELLREPDSATGLAKKLGMPRQTVNYHLRELEKAGLVEFVEERRRRNCQERVVRASARTYVVSPAALGALGCGAEEARDRFSAAYLVDAAARVIRDVASVRQKADAAGKRMATLALETEIRFANAAQRARFAEELANTMARLAMKYHDETSAGGRRFRLLVGAYPAAGSSPAPERRDVRMED